MITPHNRIIQLQIKVIQTLTYQIPKQTKPILTPVHNRISAHLMKQA